MAQFGQPFVFSTFRPFPEFMKNPDPKKFALSARQFDPTIRSNFAKTCRPLRNDDFSSGVQETKFLAKIQDHSKSRSSDEDSGRYSSNVGPNSPKKYANFSNFFSTSPPSPICRGFYYKTLDDSKSWNIPPVVEICVIINLAHGQNRVGFAMNAYNSQKSEKFEPLTIESVLEDSPAFMAGLRKNDEIVEINGFSTHGMNYGSVIRLILECIESKNIRLKIKRRVDFDSTQNDSLNVSLDRKILIQKNGSLGQPRPKIGQEPNCTNGLYRPLQPIFDNVQNDVTDSGQEKSSKMIKNHKFSDQSNGLPKTQMAILIQKPENQGNERFSESIELQDNYVKMQPIDKRENCAKIKKIDNKEISEKTQKIDKMLENISPAEKYTLEDQCLISAQHINLQVSDNFESDENKFEKSSENFRLKKYEEDLRKKRDAEMKHAAEAEFLRSSLRGSKKLRALEQGSTGSSPCHENRGFQEDDQNDIKTAEFNEILASIQKLTHSNSDQNLNLTNSSVDSDQLKPKIHDVLRITQLIRNFLDQNFDRQSACSNAYEELQGVKTFFVFEILAAASTCPTANELFSLLKKNEFSNLLWAYDQQAKIMAGTKQCTSYEYANVELDNSYCNYRPQIMGLKETSFDNSEDSGALRIIKLVKDGDLPLGATVKNEGECVLISRIIKGGVADKSGLLKEGDEILDINGCDLRGKSVHEVCDILANISGEIAFIIVPAPPETHIDSVPQSAIKHVRALFNYEPDDDPYLPCRELGLHFAKGDILHVISMMDPNWWQVLRDGEENVQQLAGLVPSASLQEQKIQYERETGGGVDQNFNESCAYQKSLLICTRGLKVRTLTRKKKISVRDQNEEIPTYEEVTLHLSPKGRRRPLILVGPPNVGCLELRHKLIESEKDIFSGVVPHTTRPKKIDEQEGVHYNFLAKSQFQEEVNSMKFVEWGEYQKFFYGTSYEAIKKVIERGKTCVMTLKVQSIMNVRRADFMPFVVFIAPPSFERLKLIRRRLGEKEAKDEELKAIIYEAKETEDRYGHLFDKILVNFDLERAYQELRTILHRLETEPQWVPCEWIKDANGSLSQH